MVQQTNIKCEENEVKISRACVELQKVLREALMNGRRGAFGVKVPLNRGTFGTIRQVIEQEISTT